MPKILEMNLIGRIVGLIGKVENDEDYEEKEAIGIKKVFVEVIACH